MGGSIGRIGLGAVGFGLGSMIGFPALGASLGMGLGGMLFPPKQEEKQRQIRSVLGSSSVEGTPLPIVFGRVRIGGTLLWKGDMVYHEIVRKKKGKGGQSSSVVADSWYTISFAMVIGEGPISLQRIYEGKNIVSPAYTWYEGTEGQLADGFLTGVTGKSIPYKHTSYIVFQDYRVGMQAQIPQLTFEVVSGQSKFDVSLTLTDVDGIVRNLTKRNYVVVADLQNCITPPYAMKELIKDDRFGGGFKRNCDWLDANTDCIDQSYFFNLAITERRDLSQLLEMIAAHGWVITIFSGSDIRLLLAKNTVPTKSYHLDDMIGKEHESVIDVSESGRSERFNRLSIEYTDPLKEYSTRPIQVEDLADQQDRGVVKNTVALPGFTDPDIAKEVGYKMMRNSLFGRRMFNFSLGPKELASEPGDVAYLNAVGVGLTLTRCRILGIDETEEFNLTITAREEPNYIFDATNYSVPASFSRPAVDTAVGLSQAIGFAIHEVPKEALLSAAVELMPVWSKQHDDTIGMNVYYSLDDISYDLLHEDRKPAPGGLLETASPLDKFLDADQTGLVIDTALGRPDISSSFDSISRASLMSTKNLSIIDNELMLFQNASLGITATYTLTDFVRGRYNTKVQPHPIGSSFHMIDDSDRIDFLKTQIGVKYYFKAVPLNTYFEEGDMSEVTPVGHTIEGWAYRPYAPGSIWLEESGVNMRSKELTSDRDLTIAWDNCSKNIGYGTFPYNTRDYGDYFGDGDITKAEVEVYTKLHSNEVTVEITASKDTYMSEQFPTTNYNTDGKILTGSSTTANRNHRGLVGFDLSSLPAGANITLANLKTYVIWNFAPAEEFTIARLTNTDWTEDATWNQYDAGLTWAIAGGTYTTNNSVTQAWVDETAAESIDITNIVGDGDGSSVDLLIKHSTEGAVLTQLQFEDREHGTASQRPILEVTYTLDSTLARTADVGLTQEYVYTALANTSDHSGVFQNEVTFKVWNKSIYGRSRWSADKSIKVID